MKSGTKAIAILLLLFAVLLQACSDDSPAPSIDYHQLNSHTVTNITATNATFSAKIITPGKEPVLEHGFTWGKTRPFIDREGFGVKNLGGRSGAGAFTATVEYPFERNKTYYVRPFVKTATTVVYGNMVSFSVTPYADTCTKCPGRACSERQARPGLPLAYFRLKYPAPVKGDPPKPHQQYYGHNRPVPRPWQRAFDNCLSGKSHQTAPHLYLLMASLAAHYHFQMRNLR